MNLCGLLLGTTCYKNGLLVELLSCVQLSLDCSLLLELLCPWGFLGKNTGWVAISSLGDLP